MKLGIYLSGLGETFTHESAEKYSRRFTRQYDFDNPENAPEYEVHVDKFEYDKQHKLVCNRVTVSEIKNGAASVVHKFYEYNYADILTRNFKSKNALVKTFLLFTTVCAKLPGMFLAMFHVSKEVGFQPRFRGQTFYLFFLFFVVSIGILFLLPAAVTVLLNIIKQDQWLTALVAWLNLDLKSVKNTLQLLTNLTALVILLAPGFNDSIVNLACEFVSAGNYLEQGDTKQTIHGQIDILLEQIIKTEGQDTEVYFHSYSFGSLVALDYLFPYGLPPSLRVKQHCEGLVTIGSPIDFIKVYYPKFFQGRNMTMATQLGWINVYSLADALGSNFRKQGDEGDAEYSFAADAPKPTNIRYEVANMDIGAIKQFFTLYALQAHGSYWDKDDDGQSCLRQMIPVMKELKFI